MNLIFHLMKGKLITFEGIDGSGKTTISKLLYEKLRNIKEAILTAEPTETWLGKAVRKALEENRDAITIAFLFMADRNEHVKKIKKWLNEGKIVICDRFADSTFAYQKEHLGIRNPEKWLYKIHEPFLIKPNITFLLIIEPKKALERIDHRKLIIYEDEKFLRKVQDNYLKIAEKEKDRFYIVNAEKNKEEIVKECLKILKERKII